MDTITISDLAKSMLVIEQEVEALTKEKQLLTLKLNDVQSKIEVFKQLQNSIIVKINSKGI